MGLCAATALGACSEQELPDNEPPVLVMQVVTTSEDTPVTIRVLDRARDPEGDVLRVVSANAGSHRVAVTATSVTVTPQQDFNGMFTVSYTVTDGSNSVKGASTVMVSPVNDPPSAKSKSQSGHDKIAIVLEASDVDGDAVTYQIVNPPVHGELTGTAPNLEYRPAAGFTGDDEFIYAARDGSATSQAARFQIRVTPSSAPTAFDTFRFVAEDDQPQIHLSASDPQGDPLTFTIVQPPSHGTLSGTAPDLVYTPELNFNGDDFFTFSASDGVASSNIARVSISLFSVDDPPVAAPQNIAISEDGITSITLAGSDPDSDFFLSFSVQQSPQHGTLSGFGQFRTYVPSANFHGSDSFTYVVSDFLSTSAPATVTIDVASVEDVPIAQSISMNVNEDGTLAVTLVGSDGDGDPITYAIGAQAQHGTLTGTPPALTYKPSQDYFGPDSFTFTVTDGDDTSPPATVSLQVKPVNDAPVASDVAVTTAEDTDVAITLQGTDVDSTTLTFSLVTSPADGTVTGSGANRVYHPAPNQSGTRSFTYRVSDGVGGVDDATVTIAIEPLNDAPLTLDDFAVTEPGTAITIAVLDNDSDAEGEPVSIDNAEAPEHGDVEIVGDKLRYTPHSGFTGVDVFSYVAVDTHGAPSTAKAHIGVGTFPPGAPAEALATIAGAISSADTTRVPAISGDGRYVAFTSSLPLVSDDSNGFEDVYVFDRGARTLARVSVSSAGAQGDAGSFRPHVSSDGRYVVFDSVAANLVAGDSNGVLDVFRHDRVTRETIRVSVASGGGQASGPSLEAEVSDDGNLVVFHSLAFDLIPSDANGTFDVFMRDVTANATARISVTASGGEGDLASTEATISGDGRFVAFASSSTNLVAGDTNNLSDVFLRDRAAGTTTRISVSSIGGEPNAACTRASLSRDGRFVSFRSAATNLVGGTPPPAAIAQIYVRDRQEQTTTLTPQPLAASNNIIAARLSADGRYLTAFSSAGVFIRDRFSGALATPSGAAAWLWPALSANGRYVVALDTSGGGRVIVAPNPL